MKIEERREGDVLVLILQGELMGGDDSGIFQDRIYQAIQENTVDVVVDMEQIKWMNSAGLGKIMAGLTTLRGSGGDLKLAHLSDRVRRPIEITKLDNVIQIFTSTEDAIASFA
jgi:anti-sigma B factor antagonist